MSKSDDSKPESKAGRVIHDARGNAVWDWVAETGRILIGNTSRLLRKLDVPELSMEDEVPKQDDGGYDPYSRGPTSKRKP
jgi:hypothetical protein